MKWTQEKLNVTRLFSGLPALPSSSLWSFIQWTHILSFLFHPYCYFRPPANLFLSFSRLWFAGLFSASHTCEAETAKQQEREEEICDLFRTSSQDGCCVEGGIQGARVCMCVLSRWTCLHVCELACPSGVPVGKWTSPASKAVRGSQRWTLMQPSFAHPSTPQASRLRWLATPAGVINLQFPLHNQSRRAKVEELHNIKLSETSYKGSFWMLLFKRSGY